jgi:hypothetical protein
MCAPALLGACLAGQTVFSSMMGTVPDPAKAMFPDARFEF